MKSCHSCNLFQIPSTPTHIIYLYVFKAFPTYLEWKLFLQKPGVKAETGQLNKICVLQKLKWNKFLFLEKESHPSPRASLDIVQLNQASVFMAQHLKSIGRMSY